MVDYNTSINSRIVLLPNENCILFVSFGVNKKENKVIFDLQIQTKHPIISFCIYSLSTEKTIVTDYSDLIAAALDRVFAFFFPDDTNVLDL